MCRRNGQEGRPKWWNDSHVSSLCIYYFTKPRYGTFSSKPRPTNFSSRSSSDRLLLVPYTSFPSTLTTICLILTLLLFSRLSFFFFNFCGASRIFSVSRRMLNVVLVGRKKGSIFGRSSSSPECYFPETGLGMHVSYYA